MPVRRLVFVETDTVLRARVIAEQRLGSVAPRWAHVRGVAAAVERMAAGLAAIEGEAVVAAAWLHDVGYAPSVRRSTGFHPVDGARFVRAQGFPAVVVSLVAYHTGAVFEARERGLLEALAEFSEPPELLLDVLTCADMTTGRDGSRVRVEDRVSEILSRYPESNPVHRAIERAAPSLLAAVARVDSLAAG
ncbi:MAG: HD domain-containing protein [Mycobacterium sp.]|uniref:HD domain-containing protein n=1 Tax=Mycobacterium sp. TaxID=1785 RepID=UPI003F9B917C